MTRNLNTIKATDALVSLVGKLPENLLVDGINEYGKFSISFLLRLTDEQLLVLKNEAAKKKADFILHFTTIKSGSTACPDPLTDFTKFDWEKVVEIKMNGYTCPSLDYHDLDEIDHVSIILVINE